MPCETCPIQRVIPEDEIKDWVHNINRTNEEVRNMKKALESKKKTSPGTMLGIVLTTMIFVFSIVYAAGGLNQSIQQNSIHIGKNTEAIESVEENTDNLQVAIIELKSMSDDIKEIKKILFEQVKLNK